MSDGPTPRDLLAEMLYLRDHWRDGKAASKSWWDALPDHARTRYQRDADHLLASPALDALVAERVAALAEDEAVVERMAERWWENETGETDRWEDLDADEREAVVENSYILDHLRALAAALAERRPSDD